MQSLAPGHVDFGERHGPTQLACLCRRWTYRNGAMRPSASRDQGFMNFSGSAILGFFRSVSAASGVSVVKP